MTESFDFLPNDSQLPLPLNAVNVDPLEFEKPIVELERRLVELRDQSEGHDLNLESEIRKIEEKLNKTKLDICVFLPRYY